MLRSRDKRDGFSIIEMIITIVVLALLGVGAARWLGDFYRHSQSVSDKAFATQKIVQIIEELRGVVANSSQQNLGVVDDYDNGAVPAKTPPTNTVPPKNLYILTTRPEVTTPGDPISNNPSLKFVRHISVRSIPNEPLARQVTVRIYYARNMQLIAESMSVLYTLANQNIPTQVYDVYVLALENVPGWWSTMSTMRPMFENVVQDLHTRAPALELRIHYITRLAYGRDPFYRPYINSAQPTNQVAPPSVYFYPGSVPQANNASFLYYVPSFIGGKRNVDGSPVGSYSLADQYNHAVRYPDELTLYAQAKTAQPSLEPSWRMLLEEINSNPQNYRNLLLINLHGEMLPLPPMRNYSDAAKDPAAHPWWRVVTHPEQLRYNGGDSPAFRVYAYDAAGGIDAGVVVPKIQIQFPGVSVNGNTHIQVNWVKGNSGGSYQWTAPAAPANGGHCDPSGNTMDAILVSKNPVQITLCNTPLDQSAASDNTGVASSQRLYGLYYIPSEVAGSVVGGKPGFAKGVGDLADNHPNVPKNTARWRILFNSPAPFAPENRVETWIGETGDKATATLKQANLSRTYVWFGQDPPVTEQFQFLGDARHMPYVDAKDWPSGTTSPPWASGYNWYASKSTTASGYLGFDQAQANNGGWTGWRPVDLNNGNLNVDVPRFFQILRGGLLQSGGIWSTVAGWMFFYVGFGGEMGGDPANGFSNGLPIMGALWNPMATTVASVDEIVTNPNADYTNARLIVKSDRSWFSIPALGELYPDDDFARWQTNGNLPSCAGSPPPSPCYYRENYMTAPFDSYFNINPVKRTGFKVPASFINGNASGDAKSAETFNQGFGGSGNISLQGNSVALVFNFPFPSTVASGGLRPFTPSKDYWGQPQEWSGNTIFSSQVTRTALLEFYYDSSYPGWQTSGLVSISRDPQVAYMAVNGAAPQTSFGSAAIARLTLTTMIRGFMEAGNPSITVGAVPQLPLISISAPTVGQEFANPSTIQISWTSAWTRWDGQPYTEDYPQPPEIYTPNPPITIQYNVKYSRDSGSTWCFIKDDSPATLGVFDPTQSYSATSYTWPVPAASFTAGTYLIRVEAYRAGLPLHYAYHQRQFYIQR